MHAGSQEHGYLWWGWGSEWEGAAGSLGSGPCSVVELGAGLSGTFGVKAPTSWTLTIGVLFRLSYLNNNIF